MRTLSDAEVIVESLESPEHFGEIFDRHAKAARQYLARRIGAQEADRLLGDVFCAAFEARVRYDEERESALPWLYGIASNLLRKFFRDEATRIAAIGKLASTLLPPEDPMQEVVASVDASTLLRRVVPIVDALPDAERETLLLFAWEDLGYDEIASVLAIPVGTVRSRLNRARRRLRQVTNDFGPVREVRPDRRLPEVTPTVLAREKERLMQAIDWNRPGAEDILRMPDVHARLAYRDELAALEHLVRVFGFEEIREARTDLGGHVLAFLRMGDGQFMIGREDPEHMIHSPTAISGSTVMMQVRVRDIDTHYQRAVAAGADITMPLEDAFYGERRYEANDLEGHRWHFAEPFTDIRARHGDAPDFAN